MLVTQLCLTVLQSHGLCPARLLCPWDSPDETTGVGCHSLFQGIFLTQDQTWVFCIAGRFFTVWATREVRLPTPVVEVTVFQHIVASEILKLHFSSPPFLCNSPGENSGVDSLSLLQGIFLTQGSNPGLPHCRQILYQLSHQGSPRIPEWVAYSLLQ